MKYEPGPYRMHIQSMNGGEIEVCRYQYDGKTLDSDVARRNVSTMFVEIFLQDDTHTGKWGGTVYDSFRTKVEHTNSGKGVSFHYPKDVVEIDPPNGHEDFEFLSENEYVSDVPNTVADDMAKELQRRVPPALISHPMNLSGIPYEKGVPDLLAWEYENPAYETAMFIEVKSPKDGLRRSQVRWFDKYKFFDGYTVWIEKL